MADVMPFLENESAIHASVDQALPPLAEVAASDLESLETIADQCSIRVNMETRTRGPGRSWNISPNIERAFVRREAKPVAEPKRQEKRKSAIPIVAPATPAVITNYDELIVMLRARADELEISRATIDHVAGFPDRLSSKILGLSQIRRIGMQSLGPLLDVLGLKLIAVPDERALERNRSRLVKRNNSQVRVHHPAV